jgi:[protein-PII] uridylyltransferase
MELLPKGIQADFTKLPDDYLINFPPAVICKHIQYAHDLAGRDVLFLHEDSQESWTLLVITRDKPGLLSKIFGVLSLHNLNVLAAQIFTWTDGTAVDTIEVNSTVGQHYDGQQWEELEADLHLAINQQLGIEHRLQRKPTRYGGAHGQSEYRLRAKVEIDNQASDKYTVVEVYAHDRIGLLYDITRSLSDFGLSIYRSRIGSRSDQAVDVFYVLDNNGLKVSDRKFQEEIKKELLHAVSKTAA